MLPRADWTIVIRSCTAYSTIVAAKPSISTECRRTSDYWNPAVRTHHVSPTVVVLASCSSKGRVHARVPGSPVVGWTDTVVYRHSARC